METQHEVAPALRPFEEVYAERAGVAEAAVGQLAAELRERAAPFGGFVDKATESFVSLLERGGKRMRGVLVLTGYEMYGGQNQEAAARAAAIVEADHAYLLVMDDIADVAEKRRGEDTVHEDMRRFLGAHTSGTRARKMGEDIANVAAADAHVLGTAALLQVGLEYDGVSPEAALRAGILWSEGLSLTAKGQIMDISSSVRPDLTEEEIIEIARLKTSYYSILKPLQLGATLAGASLEQTEAFWRYAEPAGLAFQLQDDIIGIYGDPDQTGKPPMSDIIEGKQTLLMRKALDATRGEQYSTLRSALGNPMLSVHHFNQCRNYIKSCDAYNAVREAAIQYAKEASYALTTIPDVPPQEALFLKEVAWYGANRNF